MNDNRVRPFKSRVVCDHCGLRTTAESALERWIRHHPDLQKDTGIARFDLDILIHRYMFPEDGKGVRSIQAMMFIEAKTCGAGIADAQRDTLGLLDKVIRNRKQNKHAMPRPQAENRPVKVYSKVYNRHSRLWLLGGHLLQLSGTSPENSEWMKWDWVHSITTESLIRLFRFELDPDNPIKRLDIRRRSQPFCKMPTLFDLGEKGIAAE